MPTVAPRQLPDHLLSQGLATFTVTEAEELLDASPDATRRALARLRRARQAFSPAQGFWVVVPPEFRSWGAVPADRFIDDLMQATGRSYYVALLTAADLHGASHHAPQAFQVMTDPPMRNRERVHERIRLHFYSGQHVATALTEPHNTPTGTMRVATPELTVVDLVAWPGEAGGLDNVATVLREMGSLDGLSLATVARQRERSVARRVGWMVERFGRGDNLEPLRAVAAPGQGEPVLLRAGARRRGRTDSAWGVRVNTSIDPDT